MALDFLAFAYPGAVVLAAYVIMGLTGFGSALVTVPLLAWIWPLPEVVALAISLDIVASAFHGGLNFAKVDKRGIALMMPGMLAGALIGVWFLGLVEPRWPLFILGLYVISVGVRLLLNLRAKPGKQSYLSYSLSAMLVGLIEALFATAGPVLVAMMQRRHPDVSIIRASVPVGMVAVGAIALVILIASNAVSLDLLLIRWFYTIPVALFGVWLGNRFARRVSLDRIRLAMGALLILSGFTLSRYLWL
jgi:uncharacterized membrane protein YfcA